MTFIGDRRQNFEKRFAHDDELHFKATVRRNKLLGLWAAEKLGKSGRDAEIYAMSVIDADFDEPGVVDIISKVTTDFRTAGLQQGEPEVQRMLYLLMTRAVDEIRAGA